MGFIELHNIFKTYHFGELLVPVLRGITLSVPKGDFLSLMGTSGFGKTTLMNILGCLDKVTSGDYVLEDVNVESLSSNQLARLRNTKIGFVFQNFNLLPRTTALENVLMPLSYSPLPIPDNEARAKGAHLLELVGLADRLSHEPSKLSGGQQQRVATARALINSPSILFADEPTGNLDSETSKEILSMFERLNEEQGITVILVTHDHEVAKSARRIVRIKDGIIEHDM